MFTGKAGRDLEQDRPEAAAQPQPQLLALAGLTGEPAFVSALGRAGTGVRAQAMRAMQASAGNQAVQRMIAAQRDPHVCGPGCGHHLAPRSLAGGASRDAAGPGAGRSLGPELAGGTFVEQQSFSISVGMGGPSRVAPAPKVRAAATSDAVETSAPTTPAEIPLAEPEEAAPAAPAAAGVEASAPAAAGAPGAAPAPEAEAEPEVTVNFPDVVKPELEHVRACDSVAGIIPYTGTTVVGETPPADAFGICRFGDVRVTGITAKRSGGVFLVNGTIVNTIKWGVHALGRTDIESESDTDIKKANYAGVAKDLTPDMSSSGGRPRRSDYWAKDLTERHEVFHANDVKRLGPGAATAAVSWINNQTATNLAGIQLLVNQVPDRVVATLVAGMGEPAEVRAYGDGAASYTARSGAVKKKGDAGDYK